jgi:hypothetical protein
MGRKGVILVVIIVVVVGIFVGGYLWRANHAE